MSEFTPGPWEVLGPYPSVCVGVMTDADCINCDSPEPPIYEPICIVHWCDDDFKTPPPEVAVANARLIAQSPAMYEAIKENNEYLYLILCRSPDVEDMDEVRRLFAANKAIIAAVEGK